VLAIATTEVKAGAGAASQLIAQRQYQQGVKRTHRRCNLPQLHLLVVQQRCPSANSQVVDQTGFSSCQLNPAESMERRPEQWRLEVEVVEPMLLLLGFEQIETH
jgi:hypothetical protein